jgi:mannose-1-phosphate guanylyltransferase
LAALIAKRQEADVVSAVMLTYHIVRDETGFIEMFKASARIAAKSELVFLGIMPIEPHTGYGYIGQGTARDCLSRGFCDRCLSWKA